VYSLLSRLFPIFYRILALWNAKAALGLKGRKGNLEKIRAALNEKKGPWLWLHAASLGEFEQGRPLMEKIRKAHPEYRWLLTFFSPSGYEVRKHWQGADCVAYLPFDTQKAMADVVELVQPETVFVVKYELWLNWLSVLRKNEIPTLLIAASMQPESGYFRWPLLNAYRKALTNLTAIFTQNEETAQLLGAFSGTHNIIRSGDPRYDRTRETREAFEPVEALENWIGGRFCLMGGSTWPEDERLLFDAYDALKKAHGDICLVLAPHEIDSKRMVEWEQRFPGRVSYWTRQPVKGTDILWIDTIGLLAKLYHYADVAYVGGGFRKGLHNILEAVAFGCPVAFGPEHRNRPEAAEVSTEGVAATVSSASALSAFTKQFLSDAEQKRKAQALNTAFVDTRAGASQGLYDFWVELMAKK
jgi:3-deoxy-D-manno-octulosonic-acid transferase